MPDKEPDQDLISHRREESSATAQGAIAFLRLLFSISLFVCLRRIFWTLKIPVWRPPWARTFYLLPILQIPFNDTNGGDRKVSLSSTQEFFIHVYSLISISSASIAFSMSKHFCSFSFLLQKTSTLETKS